MGSDDEPSDYRLPPAHPRFASHFSAALYESQADEFAPFGTDEGADLLSDWIGRRDELANHPAVAYLLGDGDLAQGTKWLHSLNDSPPDTYDTPLEILSAGFILLRLTGSIDPEGKQFVLRAIDHMEQTFGATAEFDLLRTDLISFEPT